jgi:hypothetical protein
MQIQLWLTAAAMTIKKALKQLQKIGTGDNNYPDGPVPVLVTLAEFAKDITARVCHFLSRPQPHFGNNPSESVTHYTMLYREMSFRLSRQFLALYSLLQIPFSQKNTYALISIYDENPHSSNI